MNLTIVLSVDEDDDRDINAAISMYQATRRWELLRSGRSAPTAQGVFLPEGDSDLPGAILGEICRMWMEGKP